MAIDTTTMFTVGDVEDRVREILLDTYVNSYRFEPKEIYRALQSAIDRVRLLKPSSRYVRGNIVGAMFVDENGDTYPIPASYDDVTVSDFRAKFVNMERRWLDAVVFYVVHRMYLKDDPDTSNANLAARYLELHTEALG